MKVDLLVGCNLKRRPEMQEMLWRTPLRKVACVLDESVSSIGYLPIEQEAGLAD